MLTTTRKLLYLLAFIGLVTMVATAVGGVGTPSITPVLLEAGVVAALAAAAGLVDRRAWPAGLVLMPLGAYLVLHGLFSMPLTAHSAGATLASYADQLRAGAHAYATHGLPFDFAAQPELKALVATVMYATVALAAFLALSLRRALPAMVVLLVLLGFALTVDEASRSVWLPLGFLLMAGALLTLSRSLERERWRSGDAFAGLATAIVAGVLALSLLGITSVAQSTPWQDWRTWGSGAGGGTALGFDWMQDYPSLLDPQNAGTVMRVKSPVASYWRANALDMFNGTSWFSSGAYWGQLEGSAAGGSYTYPVPAIDLSVPGQQVTEEFKIGSIASDYLFSGGTLTSVTLPHDMPIRMNSTHAVQLDGLLQPHATYSVTAAIPDFTASELVGLGRAYPDETLPDLALPFPIPQGGATAGGEAAWQRQMGKASDRQWLPLYSLDRRMVGDATDPYQIALRIEEYLRAAYHYSLDAPKIPHESPYAAFLFTTRTGFCQHFAGAMAILLRFNGIPARVAVGFATGQPDGNGWFVVSKRDAHAWVEAYFPGIGWVPFDPTPGRALPGPGASSTSAGFTDPYVADRTASQGSTSAGNSTDQQRLRLDKLPTGGGDLVARRAGHGGIEWRLVLGMSLAGVLLGWPLSRAALRRSRLRRGDPERRLRTGVSLLVSDLRDYGLEVQPSQTLDETARFVKAYVGLDASALMDRIQAVLFGGRAATEDDVADLDRVHRELRRRLRGRRGPVATLRAAYGLRRQGIAPSRA